MIPAPDEHDLAYDLAEFWKQFGHAHPEVGVSAANVKMLVRRCHAAEERVKQLENGIIDSLDDVMGDEEVSDDVSNSVYERARSLLGEEKFTELIQNLDDRHDLLAEAIAKG